MLGWTRVLLNSWPMRLFFGLLVVVFVFWGVGNVVDLVGSNTTIAKVGGQPIDASGVQAEYQRDAASYSQQNGGHAPDAATRRQIAEEAVSAAIRQGLLGNEEKRLGIAVPDADIRRATYAIPAFQDKDGQFSQAQFTQVLEQNGFTPDAFLADMRQQEANRQLIDAAAAGVAPPEKLLALIFAFAHEQRTAETVSVPAPAAAPPLPAKPVLERYWKNHPGQYTAPEYRTAQIVILSPALLAAHESVSEPEIAALYAQEKGQFAQTAARSVEVVTAPDEASAARLKALWQTGADWKAMQARAGAEGATAIEIDRATQDQFPSPELAQAVFAAPPDAVSGPVKGALGYYVFDVTDAVQGGAAPLSQVHDQLKSQIALQKAQAEINQDLSKLQDALAGQTPLDKLPANLGLVAVEGTMDADGNTEEGKPAPIPGGDALKGAIVKAVFAARQGDLPQLQNGPDDAYFAISLDHVTPPALKAYDQAAAQVAADWQTDQRVRTAEETASALFAKVKAGEHLADAAKAAGLTAASTGPLARPGPQAADQQGVSPALLRVIFTLKPGEGTMVQDGQGFTVAQLTGVNSPKPSDDPVGASALRDGITKSMQQDVGESLIEAIHDRVPYTVNQKLVSQLTN